MTLAALSGGGQRPPLDRAEKDVIPIIMPVYPYFDTALDALHRRYDGPRPREGRRGAVRPRLEAMIREIQRDMAARRRHMTAHACRTDSTLTNLARQCRALHAMAQRHNAAANG